MRTLKMSWARAGEGLSCSWSESPEAEKYDVVLMAVNSWSRNGDDRNTEDYTLRNLVTMLEHI
jgi:hypothetical protein